VLTPGIGANGIIIGPEEVHLVLRALATNGKNRVMSTPKVVVSDNATGTIRSVEEAPFTSVNASDTVATTSFAGFESAGTTLTVTPHITEGDHITLDYNLNFSNFTGAASNSTAPPPRTTNSFTSRVDVPDGHTVVVGGLIIENDSDTTSEVPYLGRVPVIGLAFQSRSRSRTRSKIFAFIRPIVLKDDRFRDLKFYTDVHLEQADVENPDYPPDQLMWMR
jgi:general secretion pathway protein D